MPDIALGNGQSLVASPDGSGDCCSFPTTQSSNICSTKVFIGGYGVVRQGDAMITHNYNGPCCNPHAPTLSSFSSKVFVEGRGIGRVGDAYGGNHIILTGSSKASSG